MTITIEELQVENERMKETIEDHISDKREMVLRNLRKESIKLHSLDLHRMMGYAACKMNIIAKAYKRKANKIKEYM